MRMAPLHHPYELDRRGVKRQGVLLNFDGGYADLHPWPELGDSGLPDLLRHLAEGNYGFSPLLGRAFLLAEVDREARQSKVSLLAKTMVPESHAYLGDLRTFLEKEERAAWIERLAREGFGKVKVKLRLSDADLQAREFEKLARLCLAHALKLRVDFNGSGSTATVERFLRALSTSTLDAIDFVEDPFARSELARLGGADDVARLQQALEIHFALDWFKDLPSEGFDVLVLKPAREAPEPFLESAHADIRRIVFTDSLAHPLDSVASAWSAASAFSRHPLLIDECGLLSYRAYQTNAFSEALSWEGPRFRAPPGTGFGFDELFSQLPWKPLP